MNPPKNRENTITSYSITEKNLVGNVKEQKTNYDLMTAIMICLGDKEDTAVKVLKLLNVLLSSETGAEDKCQILEDSFHIKMTRTLEREVSLMCNLSKGVEEKGIEKGRQEGLQIGLQEGLQKGILALVSSLKKLHLPPEAIQNELCEQFGLTKEQAERCLTLKK